MEQLVKKLQEANIGKVYENEPLANHTTWKIGGPADVLIEPNSIDSLKKGMELIKDAGIHWRAIGRGSNLLVSDEGIEGVVIKRRGTGVSETFTVRKISYGVGVERTLPVHSPKIERIEVVRRGQVRRAKLYYLRDRVGKAARIKEKIRR